MIIYLAALGSSLYMILVLLVTINSLLITNQWFFCFIAGYTADTLTLGGLINYIKIRMFVEKILTN